MYHHGIKPPQTIRSDYPQLRTRRPTNAECVFRLRRSKAPDARRALRRSGTYSTAFHLDHSGRQKEPDPAKQNPEIQQSKRRYLAGVSRPDLSHELAGSRRQRRGETAVDRERDAVDLMMWGRSPGLSKVLFGIAYIHSYPSKARAPLARWQRRGRKERAHVGSIVWLESVPGKPVNTRARSLRPIPEDQGALTGGEEQGRLCNLFRNAEPARESFAANCVSTLIRPGRHAISMEGSRVADDSVCL